ncbi:MAG: ABC transporter permease [Rubellimicrobium sp.]|nr:ABC transporter permease [Rubellimicrobium sp.]
MIRLERRADPSDFWRYGTPVVAVVLTILAGGVLFALLGKDPMTAIRTIFWDPLFGPFAGHTRAQIGIKAAPLILIAIGLSFGFRAGIWNIGAEGQYILGAVAGAAAGLAFYPADSRMIFVLMILCGALGGFLWAMIPAFLRVRFGTNEILVSLMLVYVAQSIVARMATSTLRNPEGFGRPGSRDLFRWESSSNGTLIEGLGLHWGGVAALAAVVVAYVAFARHRFGYDIRLAGQAPRAARLAGISPSRLVYLCLGLSGALAGLAGLFEVTGPARLINIGFPVGYGFTAIIVAFLGRLHPVGILLAGILLALTYVGGDMAQLQLQLPRAAIQLFQGMLLFFLLALDVFTAYRLRIGRGARVRRVPQ